MNLIEKCNNCDLKECIECEYTWSDLQQTIKPLVEENEELKQFKQDVVETINEYSNSNPENHIFDIDDCINITTDILLLLGIGGKNG